MQPIGLGSLSPCLDLYKPISGYKNFGNCSVGDQFFFFQTHTQTLLVCQFSHRVTPLGE